MDSIVILAQAGPNVGDFVRQVPFGPIAALCLSGILLVVAAVFIVRARAGRNDNAKRQTPPSFVPMKAAPKPRADSASLSDLPDLDLLVDNPPPARQPAPTQAAPAPVRPAKTGMFSVHTNDGATAQVVEVVTILRDVVDGGLIIQMGDKSYRDFTGDDAFRGSFLKIMRELSPIVTQSPQAKPSEPEPAIEENADETPGPEASASEAMPAVEAARPKPKPTASSGQLPGDLPKFTLEEKPQTIKTRSGLLGRSKTEFVPVPELDIAGAIEAYLQHRLQTNDDFAGRSIHVHPAEGGGVAIEVDGTFYDAVGDVTDDAVRSFLTDTIQEWQQRNTR